MGKFFREYWLWILIPFLLVSGLVAYLLLSGGAEDSVTPFTYPIY
ncbi:MAG: hypothetical protein ACI8TQ_000959 [Planctomycetota bacterium]|jgi:hypothetical protein